MAEPRYVSQRGHAFVVIGKPDCPWCVKVSNLLYQAGLSYAYVDLTNHPEERARLIEAGIQTVPQVYHKGNRVGGYEDTEKFLQNLGFDD